MVLHSNLRFTLSVGLAVALIASVTEAITKECKSNYDCSTMNAGGVQYCSANRCMSDKEGKPCKNTFLDCGGLHSCVNGKCVLGREGAPCRIDLRNCLNGYTCDAKTQKCVRGVEGVFCRTKTDCGFGHSCYLEGPVPPMKAKRRGVCKLGRFNTWACVRDTQCAGDLVCGPRGRARRCEYPNSFAAGTSIPNGLGACSRSYDCGHGLVCRHGRCHSRELGQKCKQSLFPNTRSCGWFASCIRGRCAYAREGDECESQSSQYYTAPCGVGLVCNGPRKGPFNILAKCVKGVEGMGCWDSHECAEGLICGTNRKCVKSAEGQRCFSDFSCPANAVCRKSSKTCTFNAKSVPNWDRVRVTARAKPCKYKPDCGDLPAVCLNGVCIPGAIGWACNPRNTIMGTTCDGGILREGSAGRPCKDNFNCWGGFSCVNSKCQKSFAGASCVRNYQCRDGNLCLGNPSVCGKDGKNCINDASCAAGLVCRGEFSFGICVKPSS